MKIFWSHWKDYIYKIGILPILALVLIETYKYPGLVEKFIHIKLEWILLAFAVYSCFISKLIINRNILLFFTGADLFVCILIIFIEVLNYPNYVYSTLHINPDSSLNLFIFSLILLIPYYLKDFNLLTKIAIICFFYYWVVGNMFATITLAGSKITFISRNLNFSYEDKMRQLWGRFYDCMLLARNNTPENTEIMLPPQTRLWELEGNEFLVRYFLYPRKVYSGSLELNLSINHPEYILLAWGFYTNEERVSGWPFIKVSTDKIIYLGEKNQAITYTGNYDPLMFNQLKTCGVIKLN